MLKSVRMFFEQLVYSRLKYKPIRTPVVRGNVFVILLI